jgi:ABC-type lipoprotein release transport system permease subunit
VTRRLRADHLFGLTDESFPNRPAAVANVAEIGRLPLMIALVLGVVGVVAVAHGVVLAVRRRRHDLAVLAALGMTKGQRARIVMAMAATMIGLGLVVGIPVGLFLGRLVWTLIAQGLRVEWGGTVPLLPILAVTLGAVALAMLVAVIPARSASRVRPGVALRTG